ncbi:zinc finger matrin-type protein 1 [Triplophysa rosa]|uniref:zinc finger matrin-type protein 1 n=1 Tax=Triplophysa rosa TaxID=992332 RepID=UPI002545E41D|nr:zinc finger matrin-type protein 1 [Triplophysa rosa]
MSELAASVSCSPQCAETDSNINTGDINPETVQNTISNNSQVEEALQDDSDPLKDLLTDKFCHVCEATLLYESQRVSHYEGKKHAQRVKLHLQNKNAERNKQSEECKGSLGGVSANPDKFCELCNMVFSSPTVAKSHYEGKVHAKNVRKATTNAPPHGTSTPVLGSSAPPVRPAEVAVQKQTSQEPNDTSGLGEQEVNVDDPNKYCALCKATFNNPVVAQQHYGGRKHQRNQTRQQMMDELGDQSEHASALTCPICCLTFSSIEMYQAHMQGNKHIVKEKKVKELCQSQKKVYDSYQDELADYIQVQKARGLEPKARPGTVGQTSKSLNEDINESPQPEDMMPHPALLPQRPPLAGFPQPHWPPQFPYPVDPFGFKMRGPVPHCPPEYMPHPCPPFKPGKLLKRRRSPDSYSSSSSSDSSSYTSSCSSSSDSSSSYERRRKRRRQRKMRMQGKMRHQEEECDMDRRGREEEKPGERKMKQKGDRKGSVERVEGRKWKAGRKKQRSSSEDEQSRRKRRQSKKSRRHGDHAKSRKEEGLMVRGEEEVTNEEAQGEMNENVDERTDMKDGKQKHKKDKKVKEKVNQDNRTEEERLWDETILGVF